MNPSKSSDAKPKTKVKVKTKGLGLPIVASLFLFAIMIGITMNGDLLSLMGNSVTNKYICNEGYELIGNRCKIEISAEKLGDINSDGVINNLDKKILVDYLNNKDNSVGFNKAADVNGDGKVDNGDLNKFRFYLGGVTSIDGYVCPNSYELDNNKCIKYELATKISNNYEVGSAINYNDSYWYVLSNNTDYVTLLKRDTIGDAINYNESSVNNILNDYISNIYDDLKEVDGSKIRLMNLNDLKELGFVDKTNTSYYEGINTPYWIGYVNKEYWVDDAFILVNYDNNNYAYKASNDTLAYVRPVINVYKSKLK